MHNLVAATVNAELNPQNLDSETLVTQCAVCKVDLRGRFVYVDTNVESLLGLPQEALFGREFREFVEECQHPIVDRLFTRHSRFETIFETAQLLLYHRDGHPVPASTIVSLNFVAGNAVNFQVVLRQVTDTPRLEPCDHSPTDHWSAAAAALTALRKDAKWGDAVVGLRELADATEVVVYRLTDDHPEVVCSSADPSNENPRATFVGEICDVHLEIALIGGHYSFCDSEQVQRAIEQHGTAPSEFVTHYDRGDDGKFLLRFFFDDSGSSVSAQDGIDRVKLLLSVASSNSTYAPNPSPGDTDDAASSSVDLQASSEWLSAAGFAACLLDSDMRITAANSRLRMMTPDAEAPGTLDALLDTTLAAATPIQAGLIRTAVKELAAGDINNEYTLAVTGLDGTQTQLTIRRHEKEPLLLLTIVPIHAEFTAPLLPLSTPAELVRRAETMFAECAKRIANIGHSMHANLDVARRIELAAALDGLSQCGTLLHFLSDLHAYVAKIESSAPVDLNLVVARIFEHVCRSLPERTINLSFGDLPVITTAAGKINDLLTAWVMSMAQRSTEQTVPITITAHREDARTIIEITSTASSVNAELEECRLTASLPDFGGGSTEISGSLWYMSQAVLAALNGRIQVRQCDGGNRGIAIEIPNHA